ncbi:MAG TPA: EVE domain-containing protein [Acidobacteriaceae bacterium]|nr:EVE domain-containing protein [Acidobacteriaceae bacterium]
MNYLLKTEPSAYSISDLKRDGETVWDGVTNPAAVKNLREMSPKDRVVIYHTGDERAAVGTATVVSVDAKDPKVPLVRIRFSKIVTPKTLDVVKEEPLFRDSPLVRQGRLSVVPLTDEEYQWMTRT